MPSIVNDRELRGSDFRVGISKQAEKDIVDANPVFTPVRRTEGKTSKVVSYTNDPSVQVPGQAQEQIQENQDLTMELSSVVSKQTIDWMIQAANAETTQRAVTATDIAATATGFTTTAEDFSVFPAGAGIWISGFADTLINKFYIVASSTADEIVTVEAPPATELSGASVTITSNESLNDDLPTYNIIQTRASDKTQADDINYHTLFNGIINTISMEIGETGLLSATANFVAEGELAKADGTTEDRPIAGQTISAPLTDRALTSRKNAPSGVRGFFVDDVSATCLVKSITIEINNDLQKGEAAACEATYTRGQFGVSGSAVARSKISDPFIWRRRAWDGSRAKIAVLLSHGNNDETYIALNQNVVTENVMPDGNNVAANSEISFVSEKDTVRNRTIEIYRNWTL